MRFSFLVLFLFTVHGIGTAQTVYKTPSGKKYHTATCRYVKNVSHKLSIKEARSNRLGPVPNANRINPHPLHCVVLRNWGFRKMKSRDPDPLQFNAKE